jgi:hypothetical protein
MKKRIVIHGELCELRMHGFQRKNSIVEGATPVQKFIVLWTLEHVLHTLDSGEYHLKK